MGGHKTMASLSGKGHGKNSNCDETQIVMKLKNSNCDETQKNRIVMKLKNSNCDETQKLKL